MIKDVVTLNIARYCTRCTLPGASSVSGLVGRMYYEARGAAPVLCAPCRRTLERASRVWRWHKGGATYRELRNGPVVE